jgi:hypothetical protein
MRLDFNILWVEDQPANVQSQREAIDRRIRNEGFRLQTEFARSMQEAQGFLSSDIYGDHIDLILMDYDLGAGPAGDDGLVEVRRMFPFKDIVFYSAQAADLARIVADKRVQGVFCSDRLGLPDEVAGLFESLIKKVLDIDHSRGIIMGSSSDIDGLIFDCLSAHFAKDGDVLSDPARQIILTRLAEIKKRFDETVDAVAAATKVADLAELHNVYTSIDRLNLLRKILEVGGAHAEVCAAMKVYANQTVPKRNVLAHVRVERDGFSRKLFDKKGNELTSDVVRELRHALLRHQEGFEALINRLRS